MGVYKIMEWVDHKWMRGILTYSIELSVESLLKNE